MAILANTIVVGASRDNTGAPQAGSAYIFNLVDADFNDDGVYDCVDIDALVAEIAAGNPSPLFDLTGDGLVNLGDRDAWLTTAGEINLGPGRVFLVGDATLDGIVDGLDFGVWHDNKFTVGAAWCSGDFNADGVVDGQDFIEWNNNKFQSSAGAIPVMSPQALHEPHEVDRTHPVPVNADTRSGATRMAAPLAPWAGAARRVDAVFAARRRGDDRMDAQPKVNPFEPLSPNSISPWVAS